MKALLIIGAFVCVLMGGLLCLLFLGSLFELLNRERAFAPYEAIEFLWGGLFAVVAFAPAFMLYRKKGKPVFIGLVEIVIICAFVYALMPRLH